MKNSIGILLFFTITQCAEASPVVTVTPQPDTLAYHDFFEDPDQPIYTLTGLEEYWVTVRFTPDSTFIVTTVYFVVENLAGSIDPCFIYLALDNSNGQPDPDGVLAGPIRIEGPLPHKSVIQVDLDSAVVVDSLQDFHVMVSSGGNSSYSVALELPADFPHRTGHSPESHMGPFHSYVFPTPADAIIAVGGYYDSSEQHDVDLQTTCLSNGIDLFFPDGEIGMGLTLSSEITNTGSDTAFGYTLSWNIRDQYDYVFTHYDTLPPPIPPGESRNVICPNPWITQTMGDYVISDSIFLEEDVNTSNNISFLEQYIRLSPHYDLHYDDGESDETHAIPDGNTYAVCFSPWSRIIAIDSLSVFFTDESPCRISILDGFYPDDEPGQPLFTSSDSTFQPGWHLIHLDEPITPLRSTFFIALTGIGGQANLGIDSDAPLTKQTCLPPRFYKSADGMVTWHQAETGDPLVRAYVTKRGHPQLRYVELFSCDVDPDTLSQGEIAKVKVHWEFFDATGGDPVNFYLITGLADYPAFLPLVFDTVTIQNVEPGLYIDSMSFVFPDPPPGSDTGITGALIVSEPPSSLWDYLLGELFQIVP